MTSPTQEKIPAHKGHFLKETRQAIGISLETVHEHTKIPLDALRAIEEGYTVKMLSTFYQRAFVKIYAKYLGIDVKEVIADFKEVKVLPFTPSSSKPFNKIGEPKKVETPKTEIKNVEITKSESIDFKKRVDEFLTPQRKQQLILGIVVLIGLFFIVKVLGWVVHKIKTRPNVTKEAVVKPKPNPAAAPKPQTQTPKPVVTAPVAGVKTVTESVLVTVRAKKNNWMRVKADGKVVFESQLRAGSVETWKGNQKIEIAGKNLGELEFEINGKMIGTLTRKERQAKELMITKDGLTVTK